MRSPQHLRTAFGLTCAGAALLVVFVPRATGDDPRRQRKARIKELAIRLGDAPTLDAQSASICPSTGFEASEGSCGWEAGFGICGSSFPDASGHCCNLANPNPLNGWGSGSASCVEPHIDTANPKTGRQHLRLQGDPLGGYPPGCTGFSSNCAIGARSPRQPAVPPGVTHLDLDIALLGNCLPWPHMPLQIYTLADSDPNVIGVLMYFYAAHCGVFYVHAYDGAMRGYAFLGNGFKGPDGSYSHIRVSLNACTNEYTYFFDGRAVYRHRPVGQAAGAERAAFWTNNVASNAWDIDNFQITYEECPPHCGNGSFEPAVEECDGPGLDANCPGQCIAPGQPGECTCPRQCTSDAPCPLNNAENGPYLNSDGYYLYTADTPFTSFNSCGSGFDTLLRVYDPADLNTPLVENDDCDLGPYGAGSDPGAPCYNNVLPPSGDYESCTCLATVPGNAYLVRVSQWNDASPPVGSLGRVGVYKKTACGSPISGGACCDAISGACTNGVGAAACTGDYKTYYLNKLCSMVPACEAVTGACCNAGPGSGGSCSETTLAQCPVGQYVNWSVGRSCAGVTCREVTGACCDTLLGHCATGTSGACSCDDCLWGEGAACLNCVPATGACCDGAAGGDRTRASCTATTLVECQCGKCTWTRGASCDQVICDPNFTAIPAVSEWGLVVLALLLLVGSKLSGPVAGQVLRRG